MANILDIRRRIRSVTNTRQITRAMKMVSAARLRRCQPRAAARRPHARMLEKFRKSTVPRRGFFAPVTRPGRQPMLAPSPENNLVFIEFKSMIAQRLVVEQLLPIESIGVREIAQSREMELEEKQRALEAARGAGVSLRPADTREADERAATFATAQVDYIYEQPPRELFRALLPKYVGIQIFRALLESVAAEHAARMTAMDSATSNATDMIDSLTLIMNRARQAKITKEIIEIVSGASAM